MVLNASLSLVIVRNGEHWTEYHQIRRTVLWEARGRFDYDSSHPDDYLPSNLPLLLLSDKVAVATVRLDLLDDSRTAAFRRLAVVLDKQRLGFGRALIERAETMALEHERQKFVAQVARDAVPFWKKLGYEMQSEFSLGMDDNPTMVKRAGSQNPPSRQTR
ncbi:MAG: hypothetical protein JWL63_1037 [Rhodocyclales bacterium]|nr:hypothetical protein [Rhodocyclales bacterium]